MTQLTQFSTSARPLVADGITQSFGDRRVLSDVSFAVSPGDRLAVIGENGTGKSSLLRIIAGVDSADSGTVVSPARTAMLAQELPFPQSTTVRTVLDAALAEPLTAIADIETAGVAFAAHPTDDAIAAEYSLALDRAEQLDAWNTATRTAEVLAGLSLGRIPRDRTIGQLSGGERVRLSLAALLLSRPDALIMDEPSNHLDDGALSYLEEVLISWRGLVVFASHDRTLIDRVATRVLDLDPRALSSVELADAASLANRDDADEPARADRSDRHNPTSTDDPGSGIGVRVYGTQLGGYSALRAERTHERRRWQERYLAEQRTLAELTHEIEVGSREVNRKHESKSESKISRKFYSDKDARVTARRARNATVRLETLERERVRRPPEPLRFGGLPGREEPISAVTGSEPKLLSVTNVAVHGRLAPVSLDVPRGGRILLTGPNGSGKSTLLRMLAGEISPDAGSIVRDPAAHGALLHQETVFADPSLSASEWYLDTLGPDIAEMRPLTQTGLLAPRDVDRAIGQLSVGQRRRVALATLIAQPPEILLLDEPSNHLSLALVEELEAALGDFAGTVVIASHDRWLRERWEGSELRLSREEAHSSH